MNCGSPRHSEIRRETCATLGSADDLSGTTLEVNARLGHGVFTPQHPYDSRPIPQARAQLT